MLMVIFGAGASYDSWPSLPPGRAARNSEPFRPPLAKELFLSFPPFRAVSAKYPRCQPLIPYLESQENIEEILEQFRDDAEKNDERRSQLTAIQFYIRDVIQLCELRWRQQTQGVTNYRTFVDQVQSFSEVCFVTFNYDTLLEDALEKIDVRFPDIRSYIARRSGCLFKLHGSIDWQYRLPTLKTNIRLERQPTEDDMIRAAPEPDDRAVITKKGEQLPQAELELHYNLPALAIPTVSKSRFVCPPEHVEDLRMCMRRVHQIVIVGWRAGEKHFLEILAKGLKSPVDVIAACGKEQAASETLKSLKDAGIPIRHATQSSYGFTDFVLNREVNWLLEQKA